MTLRITVIAPLAFILVAGLSPVPAAGQQKSLKEQLVGTWQYVSAVNIKPDGSRVPLFGPSPEGRISFDGKGNYVLMVARSGQPKFAANDRNQGTSDEYKAVVQGSIAHFGKYTVNEAEKTITFNIETCTFPNWNGVSQKRPFSMSGNELRWKTPAASSGGSAELVLKRLE
ncbi:hypothetical protein E4K72_17930 [Oxalobacteraceae bacterium OM1]|nr:hypothetical protein E4K72_17930 [Oxalobacteraceae bacterium OM1]